jgi:endonuclease/exonuclease/phosphatase family metal-dependent hydrolase
VTRARIRAIVRAIVRAVVCIAAPVWVPWAAMAAWDLEARSWLVPSASAFLPYAAAATAAALALALLTRVRSAAIVAAVGLVVLVAPRIDRVTRDRQPTASGPAITLATANVYIGHGDPAFLTRLVQQHHIDVFAIQENTRRGDAAMLHTPLRTLLPHRILVPGAEGKAEGLAIWSRWPIAAVPRPPGDARSLGVIVHPPGASPIQVRSVHPFPPFSAQNLVCWRQCIRALTHAGVPAAHTTILAGDWNATLDHHPIRDLVASGFRDAAEQRGLGWRPTWSNGSWGGLAIDHVFVSRGVAVEEVAAHNLPRSDHDVVVVRLRLPHAVPPR